MLKLINLSLLSFGFKYAVPQEIDFLFDARFIQNPYYSDNLRPMSGLDKPVSSFVMALPEANQFLDQIDSMLRFSLPYFQREGRAYLTAAIGCTGGRHRSPALVENLAERLGGAFGPIRVEHRDLHK